MTDHNIVRMVHAIEERISGGGAADINSGKASYMAKGGS